LPFREGAFSTSPPYFARVLGFSQFDVFAIRENKRVPYFFFPFCLYWLRSLSCDHDSGLNGGHSRFFVITSVSAEFPFSPFLSLYDILLEEQPWLSPFYLSVRTTQGPPALSLPMTNFLVYLVD